MSVDTIPLLKVIAPTVEQLNADHITQVMIISKYISKHLLTLKNLASR